MLMVDLNDVVKGLINGCYLTTEDKKEFLFCVIKELGIDLPYNTINTEAIQNYIDDNFLDISFFYTDDSILEYIESHEDILKEYLSDNGYKIVPDDTCTASPDDLSREDVEAWCEANGFDLISKNDC